MMITTAIIDQLIEIIKQHYSTSPLIHLRDVDAAIVAMPDSVQSSLHHLEDSGIPRHALRSVAACLLTVRLSDRTEKLDPADGALLAMHAVMGAVVALDGGNLPFPFERNDPDCCDYVNAGVIEICLELASRDHTTKAAATARRIIGLCYVNLVASGQLVPLPWSTPREMMMDEIAALGTLFVEESNGYYDGTIRPDDIWDAYSKALLLIDEHGWSAAASLRHIITQSAAAGGTGAIRGRVLH
jgi:hypothetical protein